MLAAMGLSSRGDGTDMPQEGSSSTPRLPEPARFLDDSDDEDLVASLPADEAVLSGDPLDGAAGDFVSFKRKNKPSITSSFQNSIPNFFNRRHAPPADPPRSGTPRSQNSHQHTQNGGVIPMSDDTFNHPKDGAPLDWYVEGPGRRVGYEDLTAIDWIFEYTKERQRLRALYSNATGLIGYLQKMLDSSQVWIVLIVTGLATGLIAAAIDIASDWLGDIKTGYCGAGGDGGRFYLNRYFCCWGYEEWAQCQDWVSWAKALHISSAGGKWFIEYFFFIGLSVSHHVPLPQQTEY
jgi:chloride channel 3/4/5